MRNKTFLAINFGCRVNAAELNQLSQKYIDLGFSPCHPERSEGSISPDLIIINTCSVTKKGDIESLSKIRVLSKKFPHAQIIATGCARLDKVKDISNVTVISNQQKNLLSTSYTPKIKDKFSHTHRYLLKVQTGCSQMCTFCIVPYRRPNLWSLSISDAVTTVNKAICDGYTEVIITGVNLEQYQFGFSNLVEALLTQTTIPLISFGSIPINCIDKKFLSLLSTFNFRLSPFLHIPVQSGSNKILELMNRPYNKEKIIQTFNEIKSHSRPDRESIIFGTDIIVGFPNETEADFQETINLCKSIGFSKIHTFKYSPRTQTVGQLLWSKSEKIDPKVLKDRHSRIQKSIISYTISPSIASQSTIRIRPRGSTLI